MPLPFDTDAFREQLERACRQAVHDYRALPCEETYHRACGRLDGLLQGVFALIRAQQGPTAMTPVEMAREVVERFRAELDEPAS